MNYLVGLMLIGGEVEWLPGPMSMGVFTQGAHLWFATQEQRDFQVLPSLDVFRATLAIWALAWLTKLKEATRLDRGW